MTSPLDRFSPATREWFAGAFRAPTNAQAGAWQAISGGDNALVIAPTGSGKTLAAFLWAIDRLTAASPSEADAAKDRGSLDPLRRTRVLYISPLKALAVDVERNLRAPLVGVTQTARRLGMQPTEVTVGVRSGDTPPAERRLLQRRPPDILITTPESLYLMLTSSAREGLRAVDTVIVDEVHAVASTKRGAHLALSLERLDLLLDAPAQRIGLSATVRPREEVARFLGGSAPVTIVAPQATKRFDLTVSVPVEDMTELGTASTGGPASAATRRGSIWPHVEETIVDRILEQRSTIVFANSRRLAERLTGRLNEIYAERLDATAGRVDPAGRVGPPGRIETSPPAGRVGPPGRIETSAPAGRVGPPGRIETPAPAGRVGPQGRIETPGEDDSLGLDTLAARATRPTEGTRATRPTEGAPLLARAHHGSVSRDQRAIIEDDLKSGRLRCVVATSSLELGIDMGAVDLVIQVESPPSVASGLQRIGRAGHQVDEISRGIIFPKHRADLLHSAVASERMTAGLIEALAIPQNPLDILAQQTVAAVALDTVDVEDWFDTVRRSAPFQHMPRSAYEATLDLLSGRYPSDEFAELRPRIVWDRVKGTIAGRPGAQRLAVTSGGTIPDRGLFGVFLVGSDPSKSAGGRVGELDEEMVYESRVGDIFALGTTSWKIEEITHDRVIVSPAFGQPARAPFWRGDGIGRPAELGRAIGAFTREVATGAAETIRNRIAGGGLDERAVNNLIAFVNDQRTATGQVPTDTTLVVERFRDELGDWRVILHSPYGMQVHAPWALAVGARLQQRFGIDAAAMASDDGIVLRVPDTDDEPPGAELFLFDPEQLREVVTEEVGGSALFASRFRECAARALLLPRYNPGKRAPLWQQRQRSSQLLAVASRYPTFPIVLETVREVLQDVYDLPALTALASEIEGRRIRVVEAQTEQASPFARSLLFGYVAAFMYEGDSPLAERRAAALSLDSTLLAELLGRAELRELLDADVIEQTELELQRLARDRRARDVEGVVDLLRLLGPLSLPEIVERSWLAEPSPAGRVASANERTETPEANGLDTAASGLLDQRTDTHAGRVANTSERAETPDANGLDTAASGLLDQRENAGPLDRRDAQLRALLEPLRRDNRLLVATVAGVERWAVVEDAGRLRDALGTPLPIGIPAAFIEPVDDPLGDLVARFARTHAPFTVIAVAERLGLGSAVVLETLRRVAQQRRVVEGEFRPGSSGSEWCDVEVLRRLRSRSLAALRHEVEPVDATTLARFLPAWQHVTEPLRGVDGVVQAIDQLAGVELPASAWESLVLPSRVADYSPVMLDELTASGEVLWSGGGALPGSDGWVGLHLAESAPLTLAAPAGDETTPLQRQILESLAGGGAYFFRQLAAAVGSTDDRELLEALWQLVWAGLITNDTFAPLRSHLGGPARPRAVTRGRPSRGRMRRMLPSHSGPPSAVGRWSLLPPVEADPTVRAIAVAEQLLERHGVITRGAVTSEAIRGGFALVYKVLSGFEESSRARRGYFVEGLGAAQFATGATVDRLRSYTRDAHSTEPPAAITLAATDPANPYGAALPWPLNADADTKGHRPGRKAGALVTLVDGRLALYVERGGKTMLTFGSDEVTLAAAATSLAAAARRARLLLKAEKADGTFVIGTPLGAALTAAGFSATPQGLRLRG